MSVKKIILLLLVGLLLSGCVTSGKYSSTIPVKKVALVALNVNNYSLYGGSGMISSGLIDKNLKVMLNSTEQALGKHWKVKPVKSFIRNKSFYNLSQGRANKKYFAPKVRGKEMPVFSTNRKEVIKGTLDTNTAVKLCSTLKVDAVVLVYTEWTVQAGRLVPTIKALTKNCISMYNKKGEHVFYGRKDFLGDRPIGGAFAGVHINEETIDQWVDSYKKGVEFVISRNAKRAK